MSTAPFLAGALLIATAIAQDPATTPPAPATAAERLQELQQLQQKCVADWRAEVQKAQAAAKDAKPGEAMPALPMRPDFSPIVAKAKAFADEFAGTDDAVPFLLFVVQNGGTQKAQKDTVRAAFETLLDRHLDSPKLATFGPGMPFIGQTVDPEFGQQALDRLEKSADPAVRGWALLARHQATIENADRESAEYAAAKQTLQDAARLAKDERLAKEIRGAIDLREKFGIGCVAPDIVGVDLDGVEFKLSDYEGKVVFLDFWGDW